MKNIYLLEFSNKLNGTEILYLTYTVKYRKRNGTETVAGKIVKVS